MFNKKSKKLQKTIEKSGLFDKVFYLKTYRDVRLVDMTPIEHYVTIGIKEDRKPNATFDPVWYREYYEDVKEDGAYPLVHYILFGRKENRFQNKAEIEEKQNSSQDQEIVIETNIDFNKLNEKQILAVKEAFDNAYYLETYLDIKEAKMDPFEHYMNHGWKEGRDPSKEFDTKFYVAQYKDVQGINPFAHYVLAGRSEGRFANKAEIEEKQNSSQDQEIVIETNIDFNKLNEKQILAVKEAFDNAYYLETYLDIKEAKMDPFEHYMNHGWKEGRDPSKEFDTKFYVAQYKDIQGINPFTHYVLAGKSEGRFANKLLLENFDIIKSSGLFDSKYYLNTYEKDLIQAKVDPLKHFIQYGWRESRNPNADFNIQHYVDENNDVDFDSVNPLSHYIVSKDGNGEENKKEKFVEYKEHEPLDSKLKTIAFYLPQFHPFPENDAWWGKGFTEWTNVSKAKPNFKGHHQPHLPIHNGFYDLRVPEVMMEQAKLARNYGIHGFNFYYYWFNGKILMHKPFEILLKHKEININFCITWANENWTRRWDGAENDILMGQNHCEEDSIQFIENLYKFFEDERYIRVNNKPVLIIYRADIIPNMKETVELWRRKVKEAGFEGIYIICSQTFGIKSPVPYGFDAAMEFPPHTVYSSDITKSVNFTNQNFEGVVYDYNQVVDNTIYSEEPDFKLYRTAMLSWDNTARKQNASHIFKNFTLSKYKQWISSLASKVYDNDKYNDDEKLIFINAWNEWAEGTHLEPDRKYGYGYLETTYDVLKEYQEKKKIIIISHDAYKYGAEYLALNIAKYLKNYFNYEVKILFAQKTYENCANLISEFIEIGEVFYLDSKNSNEIQNICQTLYAQGYKKAIANTSVVGEIVETLNFNNIETISLIHEMKSVIKENSLETSIDKIVKNAKTIVFPSNIVKNDFQEFQSLDGISNIIKPQGLFRKNKYKYDRELAKKELVNELNIEQTDKIILNIAHGEYRKGLDLFIEVAEKTIKNNPTIHFVWVGECLNDLLDKSKEKVNDKKIFKNLHFVGAKNSIEHYYAGSDIFFLSSREDPFPSVVLDAMNVGLPVIAFKGAGGFEDVISKGCGLLVAKDDTQAIQNSIIRLLEDKNLYDEINRKSQEIIETEYSFNNYLFKILELLDENIQKVSVIVPCYNHEKYIKERLESIINQPYPIYEIIFLDDKSSDNSVKIAKEILANSVIPYKIIVNEQNSGSPFKQWKKGIDLAEGEIIWIAEGDDSCSDNFLTTLVPYFNDQFVNIAYAKTEIMNENSEITLGAFDEYFNSASPGKFKTNYIKTGNEEINEQLGAMNTLINASGLLIRKSSFGNTLIDAQKHKMCGDWLIYIECLKNGKIAYDINAINYFRRHSASQVAKTEGSEAYFKEIEEISKYTFSNFKIGDALKNKTFEFITKEWDRFKYKHSNKKLNDFYDKEMLIELYKNKNKLPSIAVIASDFSPGGGQLFSIRLANAWKKIGGNVVLLNVDKHPKNMEIIKKIDKSVPWYDVQDINFEEIVETYGIDVVHSSIWWADKYVFENIDNVKSKIKWVLSMHGCYESLLENPHWDGNFLEYLPKMLDKVDEWVYTAEKNKKIFEVYAYPQNLSKVLNGYEPETPLKIERSTLGIDESSTVLCLASRAIESKGWYNAVEAIKVLDQRGVKVDLLLIGVGEAEVELKNKYGDAKNIHFIGQVSNLSDYIALSDIGILPSTFIGESMPLVLIEFMAQGKPIISTNVGEIESMLCDENGKAGFILDVKDNKINLDEFVESIITLSNDKKIALASAKNSKRLFEKFKMENMIEEYKKLYIKGLR